jgi:hypothetical protein
LTTARAVLISRDLLFGSRVVAAAERAGVELLRLDGLAGLPPASSVRLLLIDWNLRERDWVRRLTEWAAASATGGRPPRVVVFGPHTDLVAHAAARKSGFGPMWARSKVLLELPRLLDATLEAGTS